MPDPVTGAYFIFPTTCRVSEFMEILWSKERNPTEILVSRKGDFVALSIHHGGGGPSCGTLQEFFIGGGWANFQAMEK